MGTRSFETLRLVKAEDLNHHGTLFAGRACAWLIEAGFIAAAALTDPAHIVCRKVHGMAFSQPVSNGSLLRIRARVVFAGRSRLVVCVTAGPHDAVADVIESFMTFVHVDESGASRPHGVSVMPETDEERRLHDIARTLN